jgi:hypothetical protein
MPEPITVSISGDALTSFRRGGMKAVERLLAKADEIFARLREKVIGSYLSGQMLERRSGHLQESVQVIPATLEGEKIIAGLQAGGELAPYGTYFVEGGKGPYDIIPIGKKALAFFVAEGSMTNKSGKYFRDFVTVKHVTHPAIEKRDFMHAAFDEDFLGMIGELEATIPPALGDWDVAGFK